MRDYTDRRVTPPKRVTSPTWGPPPPCKQTLRIYLCLSRDFVNQHACFCCSIYVETAQNSREECNEFAELLFRRLSLCLSRDSLSCDTRSLDLCILFDSSLYFYTFNTFRPILALFTHFTFQGRFPFTQNFRNFRFGDKWNTFRRFVPLENSQKKWKI